MPDQAQRVLVVDDDEAAADSMEIFLQQNGFETRVAYDGFSAIDIATEFSPQIVLMDIVMPRMNGLDAAQVMRDCSPNEEIFLVALTALQGVEDCKNSRDAGFHLHLVKPLSPEKLVELVQALQKLAA